MRLALGQKLDCSMQLARVSGALAQMRVMTSNARSARSAREESFLDEFNRTRKPPQKSIDYFSSIPWTKSLLESMSYEMIPFYSRYLNESTGESRFFAQTVNTETTVAHVLGFCRKDLATSTQTENHQSLIPESDKPMHSDVACLMHFGRDLESHPGIVQGGFLGSVFDEVMYQVLLLHGNRDEIIHPQPKHYTLSITTKFHAPVRAPNDVLVRAGLVAREGRKWFVNAQIEDSVGNILTSGESSWLTARSSVS